MKYEILSDKTYEVLRCFNYGCYIKNKKSNKYYFIEDFTKVNVRSFPNVKKVQWSYIDTIYFLLIALSIVSFVYLFFIKYDTIYDNTYVVSNHIYIYGLIYSFVNIMLHELSHYIAMKLYERTPGKVRFKRYHIFLTVVTDTTDSYMLPHYRRFVVYYSGVMINLLVYSLTVLIFPSYAYLLRLVIWGILYNMLPFGGLESDGYHILVNVILKINETRECKKIIPLLLKIFFICFAFLSFIESILTLLDKPSISGILYSVF
jgi:hypothetical protein